MVSIRVETGQTLVDIALQYYGNTEGWVQVAIDNGLSLTEEELPETVMLRDEMVIDRQIVTFYAQNQTIVATDNQ